MSEKTDNELINEILAKAKDKGITFNFNVDILISEMTMLLQKERALLLSQSKIDKLERKYNTLQGRIQYLQSSLLINYQGVGWTDDYFKGWTDRGLIIVNALKELESI